MGGLIEQDQCDYLERLDPFGEAVRAARTAIEHDPTLRVVLTNSCMSVLMFRDEAGRIRTEVQDLTQV